MLQSRHWLNVWLLKNIKSRVRKVLKRSFFKFNINTNRVDLTYFQSPKYDDDSVHRNEDYIASKQRQLLYYKYYRKSFLKREVTRIARNLRWLVFPKNIESINKYKIVLPTAGSILLKKLAKAADQLPEQLIINQLSSDFIAPSLTSLEQLQYDNSTQQYFESYLKYNVKRAKRKNEKVGIQKSVKSINTFFEEIHSSKFKKTADVFVPSTSLDKIVLLDTTSSKIEPLSFNEDCFDQFQKWLYLTNTYYKDFFFCLILLRKLSF